MLRKKLSRRHFISTVTAAGMFAPSILMHEHQKSEHRYPLAFSTLGCPKWTWKTILEQASQLGYSAIELRGLQGEMDLTKRPEFNGEQTKQSLQDLRALNLRISDLGSSAHLHETDPARHTEQMDQAKRFIELAHRLNVPYVRVFGDKIPDGQSKAEAADHVALGLKELGQFARGSNVAVIIESHGDFTDSDTLLRILRAAEMPSTGLLWDAHHTVVAGKEDPAATFARLGRYIRHVHLKDSKPNGKEVQYVLTGEGSVPVRQTVEVLAKGGYQGYYCFEWEKVWHPEIEEPEIAIPHFAKTVGSYLEGAGVNKRSKT